LGALPDKHIASRGRERDWEFIRGQRKGMITTRRGGFGAAGALFVGHAA